MSTYNVENLQVLKGLEAVRKRPGMYIGSTDAKGLHHLIWEIVDNSIDEVLAGFATILKVTLTKEGTVIVEDNGRGIPVGKHKSGQSGVELVFTQLHAGGKFDGDSYKSSGGLHGVGASVVNALSDSLKVWVYKQSYTYYTEFTNGGSIKKHTKKTEKTSKKGTKIEFLPNYKLFKNNSFDANIIAERLQESAFLNNKLTIFFKDENTKRSETYVYKKGLEAFVNFMSSSKKQVTSVSSFMELKNEIEVDCAFTWTEDYNETILSFVNNIRTNDGGSHINGLKSAFTKTFNEWVNEKKSSKKINYEGEDIREGMMIVLSLQIPEKLLEFVGQTKDKLGTPEAKNIVEEVVSKAFKFWLLENTQQANKVLTKVKRASESRLAARKARLEARAVKSRIKEKPILSGKLTPAQSKNPLEKEIFLVEGDSAGGSAKSGRNRKYQAILPLRGKVINTEKARLVDVLKNEEIMTIINTLNTGIGEDFDIKKLKYHKIIIMTDADTDGAHIQILLLTFFFRYMRELIRHRKVFIALPPLYKITYKPKQKNVTYAWSESELAQLTANRKYELQRYKGLGEMNADQLWETTMDPKTRQLIEVTLEDMAIAERRVATLMGSSPENRKIWITNNVNFDNTDDFDISLRAENV